MTRTLARLTLCSMLLAILGAENALAHVSERALVLLLPTDLYIRAGVAAVILTVVLLVIVPTRMFDPVFRLCRLPFAFPGSFGPIPSLLSLALLVTCVTVGLTGPRDPLVNPLPLLIWTLFWICLPVVQVVFGDIWAVINPWSALYRALKIAPVWTYPATLGHWPSVFGLIGFALFMIVDIAPDDPARLATVVGLYWLTILGGMIAFGPRFLRRAEMFTALFTQIAKMAPLWRRGVSVPGARLLHHPTRGLSVGALMIAYLGVGSFDGLNETFWWLATIGINPLAFPGRSAVMMQNSAGLIGGVVGLGVIFVATAWLGVRIAGGRHLERGYIAALAGSLLPIAMGYHIAHYLTAAMINGQYALAALSDPFGTGADYLGLGTYYVTTGFLNSPDSVERIWLTQAGAVVVGHIVAILLAHAIGLRWFGSARAALLSQMPMAIFMVAYTVFGLWLLAQPTGA